MKKINLLLVFMLLLSVGLKAKTYRYNLDSLRTIIDSTSSDSLKFSAWNSMVFELMCHVNRKDADSVLSLMKSRADQLNNNNCFFKYYASYADYYLLISRHDSSTMMSEKARQYIAGFDTSRQEIKTQLWKFYYKLGYVYAYVNKDSATSNYLKAEKILGGILRTAEDSSWYIRIISGLSINYQSNKNYDTAIKYAEKGMKLADEMQDNASLALLQNIIADLYTDSNAFEEAILHYRKGINHGDRERSDRLALHQNDTTHIEVYQVEFRLSQLYFGLGEIYYKQNLFDSALVALQKSLYYSRTALIDVQAPVISDLIKTYCALKRCSEAKGYVDLLESKLEFKNANYEHFTIANDLGRYYLDTKNMEKARKLADFLKGSAEAINTWEKKAACYNYLSDLSKAERKFKEALEFFALAQMYNDSMHQQKIANELTEVKSKYEAEKKDNQILLLKKDNDIQQASVEKQKLARNYAYAGMAALFLFGGFTYHRYRQRKKLSEQLGDSLQQLKSTQQQVIKVEKEKEAEKLRVRISRDIHDDIGSHLSKMALHSELISAGNISDTNELRNSLQSIAENSRTVINSLGEIVWAVSPNQDSLQSLLAYMRKHLDKFLKDTGVADQINFPDTVEDIMLMPDVKRNLFLVFKEATNNVVKYAQAKNIAVSFKQSGLSFEMTIRDDGKGFNVADAMNKGNGLNNMRERVKQLNGTFEIQSESGKGCTVVVKGVFA